MISPILDIVPLALTPPPPGTTLLFTSANGVRAAAAQTDLRGFDAVAVGDRTADVARDLGISCRSAEGTVEDLLRLLLADPPAGPLLHLRGMHSTGDLAARLGAAGMQADGAVVYDQVAQPLSGGAQDLLHGDATVILPLFSPRSASLLSDAIPKAGAPLAPVALSPAVAAAWGGPGTPRIARTPDAASMLHAILTAVP